MTSRNHIHLFLSWATMGLLGCGGCGPSVTSIVPNTGAASGGTPVTITGTGFTGVQSVTIGGQPLTGLSVTGSVSLTGMTPPGALGPQDVVVTTNSGPVTLAGGFEYVFQSPRQLGTDGNDRGLAIATDRSGNVYVTGNTGGSFPGTSNAGPYDVFVMKLDAGGRLQWTRQLGTLYNEIPYALAVDEGGVFVAGRTSGSLLGFTNAGADDMFVMKLDANGEMQWVRQLGTAGNDQIYGIVTDGNGNIFASGWTNGSLPGFTNAGDYDAVVIKLDANGSYQWIQQLGTTAVDIGITIDADGNGNALVAGWTAGSFQGSTNAGGNDVLAMKLNGSGQPQWIQQFGTPGDDAAHGVATDNSGNVFVAASTFGSFPGFTNAGGEDALVMKLNNADGLPQWTQQMGVAGDDQAVRIATDTGDNVYVEGITSGDFPGFSNAGSWDILVMRLSNASGQPQWIRQVGSDSLDEANGITTDVSANIYGTGFTWGGFPGFTNAGGQDLFLLKYSPSGDPL